MARTYACALASGKPFDSHTSSASQCGHFSTGCFRMTCSGHGDGGVGGGRGAGVILMAGLA